MLVRFSLENWMSFRDKVSFSMIASRERQHGERIAKIGKYQTRILPIAAIYGGNASGKTHFFKALHFARRLIVRGTQPDSLIPVEPFLLDDRYAYLPSCFSFELLIEGIMYEFSFAVTRKAVLEEKLTLITSRSENVLYHRVDGKPNFHRSLCHDPFFDFAFQGTRDNQLFLTNSVSQKIEKFKPVYDWFKNTLELLAPDSRFEPFEIFLDEKNSFYKEMNNLLWQLDTGIEHLGCQTIPIENFLRSDDPQKVKLQEEVQEGMTVLFLIEPLHERLVVTRNDDKLIVKKLVAIHKKNDGTEVRFEMRQESDGTNRVIELLPAFLRLSALNCNKVYVIDEIDRSLHTLLMRQLIEGYLASCTSDSRSQLLMTTHDVALMDQELLRRDEMWITERESGGKSTLFPFSEYKDIRYDKDIRKSYLQGRMGGIPRILISGVLSSNSPSRAKKFRTKEQAEAANLSEKNV